MKMLKSLSSLAGDMSPAATGSTQGFFFPVQTFVKPQLHHQKQKCSYFYKWVNFLVC